MGAAAAAAVLPVSISDGEGTNKPSAVLSRRAVITMCAVSLLFAWLTAWALSRSDAAAGDGEKDKFSVVRRLSPPICAYLFFWTVALSESEPAAASGALGGRFVRASYLPLLAYVAAKLVGPLAAATAACVATSFAAAAAGRALAERRLRAGADQSAAAAAEATARYRSSPEEEDAGLVRSVAVFNVAFFAAALLCFTAFMWLNSGGETALVMVVPFTAPYLLGARLVLLRGGPLEGAGSDEAALAISFLVIGWVVLVVVFCVAFSEAAMVIVSWAGTTAMAGYLGYGVAVHRSFEQLMDVKRREPPVVQDASGLPVGRDGGEDAAAVHIDAVTCVSRWRSTREYFYQEETGASLPDDILRSDREVERRMCSLHPACDGYS